MRAGVDPSAAGAELARSYPASWTVPSAGPGPVGLVVAGCIAAMAASSWCLAVGLDWWLVAPLRDHARQAGAERPLDASSTIAATQLPRIVLPEFELPDLGEIGGDAVHLPAIRKTQNSPPYGNLNEKLGDAGSEWAYGDHR